MLTRTCRCPAVVRRSWHSPDRSGARSHLAVVAHLEVTRRLQAGQGTTGQKGHHRRDLREDEGQRSGLRMHIQGHKSSSRLFRRLLRTVLFMWLSFCAAVLPLSSRLKCKSALMQRNTRVLIPSPVFCACALPCAVVCCVLCFAGGAAGGGSHRRWERSPLAFPWLGHLTLALNTPYWWRVAAPQPVCTTPQPNSNSNSR